MTPPYFYYMLTAALIVSIAFNGIRLFSVLTARKRNSQEASRPWYTTPSTISPLAFLLMSLGVAMIFSTEKDLSPLNPLFASVCGALVCIGLGLLVYSAMLKEPSSTPLD